MRSRLALIALFVVACAAALPAQDFLSPTGPKNPVRIDQKLNQQIPLDLKFRDETGKEVRLGDYFTGERPVVLTLNYFRCPMLCNMALEGLTTALTELKFDMNRDFEVVTVSFDPRDTPQAAAEKKSTFVRRYGRPGSENGWHFLTGDQESIAALTDAVGFHYVYDKKLDQFAHGSGVIVLTPKGRISRYLYGIVFPSRDLRLALVESASNKIGTITDQVLLLCYHYDPATGQYSRIAMNFVRLGGVATVLAIAGFAFMMLRRDRQRA